ncbi:MAG: hypothetical protein M3Q65_18715 [Chloroflexota bacterium]|nr:hypothetical protein [Chloroflexota bacterium]
MQVVVRPKLAQQIERIFASGVRAETAVGLAARLGVDEDDVLDVLIGLVASGRLHVIEEGSLLIFLTPAYSRSLTLAA